MHIVLNLQWSDFRKFTHFVNHMRFWHKKTRQIVLSRTPTNSITGKVIPRFLCYPTPALGNKENERNKKLIAWLKFSPRHNSWDNLGATSRGTLLILCRSATVFFAYGTPRR